MAPVLVSGAVAIVTGGSSGIGAATTAALVAAGWQVAVWARNESRNAALEARFDGAVRTYACDVGDADQVREAYRQTTADLGAAHGLVCAAGSLVRAPTFARRRDLDSWRSEVQANLDTVITPVWQLLQAPAAPEGRSIVVVASLAAQSGQPLADAYTAAKGAAVAFVRSLAAQTGRFGVRVNAVLPGWIETPMTTPLLGWGDTRNRVGERIPLGRLGRPEDVAPLITFLLGEGGAFITGQSVVVDGGFSVS